MGKAWPWILLGVVVLAAAFFWLRRSTTAALPSSTGGGAAPHSQSQAASIASAISGTASLFQAGASIFDEFSSDS